jgi:hypothetical protein
VTVEPCRKTNFGFNVTVEPYEGRITCISRRSNRLLSAFGLSGTVCSRNGLTIDS